MKRTFIALFALMLLAVPALAATFPTGGPRTTNNDDSCDISTLPAATLLLPYFEVDVDRPTGQTTLFSVTNVTNVEQIARVTLWTDLSYPVVTFNLFLTGYDVQSINLYDIIERGIIAPDAGTGTAVSPRGKYSDPNTALDLTSCRRLPGQVDNAYVNLMQSAFLEGFIAPLGPLEGCARVGNVHENAVGYATIDVVGVCREHQPQDSEYFREDIRFDNVLTGDYQQVNSTENYAQGNPLVHIRAMPEGGTPASRRTGAENEVNFERTFYERFSPVTHSDARQPLPSTFAARWIQGGPLEFQTLYKIWRETLTDDDSDCADFVGNNDLPVTEVVVFDENENFAARATQQNEVLGLPATSLLAVNDDDMPQLTNGALSGWTYFNLDVEADDDEASQNWVIVSMRSQGRYSVDFESTALGNGCTPERGLSEARREGGIVIGPAPNVNP